jgi:RND family efflux transporter MFP subunit
MEEKSQSIITGFILIICGVGVFILLQVFRPVPELVPLVDTTPVVELIKIEKLNGPLSVVGEGLVRPRKTVKISPQVNGEVVYKSPDLNPGGHFLKGDILLKIDPRNYESEVTRIRGTLHATESQLTYARQQVKRLSDLQARNAESESRLDEQIAQQGNLEGQLLSLKAQLNRALFDLERTQIKAPFDGAVFTEEVDIGNVVAQGQVLSQIYADDIFEIIVALDDLEASLIPHLWDTERAPKKVKAFVKSDYGNETYQWEAYLDAVETGLDQTARTINAVVLVKNPRKTLGKSGVVDDSAPPLLPGMYTSVSIQGLSPEDSAIVPATAIHGNNYIWWLDDESTLQIEQVKILQAYGDTVVIQSSIIESVNEIITSNLPSAVKGMHLRRYQDTTEPNR